VHRREQRVGCDERYQPREADRHARDLPAAIARAERRVGEEHDAGHGEGVEQRDRRDVRVLVRADDQVVALYVSEREEQPLPPGAATLALRHGTIDSASGRGRWPPQRMQKKHKVGRE